MAEKPLFSVVIPALNEQECLVGCLESIGKSPDVEVIVADGGSTDDTCRLADNWGARVVKSSPPRGRQCNEAARVAAGEILVFVHADSILPPGAFGELKTYFSDPGVMAGNFKLAFDARHWLLWILTMIIRFDFGLFRFGDRGLVIRSQLFKRLGGYRQWSLFEDVDLCRRAGRVSRLRRFPASITTSARRFKQKGVIYQQVKNTVCVGMYLAGVNPSCIAVYYYGKKSAASTRSLVVMIRSPGSAGIKKRLARSIGAQKAEEFYFFCVDRVLQRLSRLPAVNKNLYHTPTDNLQAMQKWQKLGFNLVQQKGPDLSRRLENAFRSQFESGSGSVVAVASDVPDLSAEIIREAFDFLERVDLVVGPCPDAGYYLIGMNAFRPSLFEPVRQTGSNVCDETVKLATGMGLSVHILDALCDIDTKKDLQRWESGRANFPKLKTGWGK